MSLTQWFHRHGEWILHKMIKWFFSLKLMNDLMNVVVICALNFSIKYTYWYLYWDTGDWKGTICNASLHQNTSACLLTPGLRKDIRCHVCMTTLLSMLANHQIRHQAIRNMGCHLVIADGQLIFLRGLCRFVWVNILTLSPQRFNCHYNIIITSYL